MDHPSSADHPQPLSSCSSSGVIPNASPPQNEPDSKPQAVKKAHPRTRMILCILVFILSLGLGISIGYSQRTPDFNPTTAYSPVNTSRTITVWTDLISVDASGGTMTLDWSVKNDTACDATQSPPCPTVNPNSTVDFYFDANILSQGGGANGQILSDNVPDIPIFRHNATAVASNDVRNSLAGFRTSLALFSSETGRSGLSSLQRYPFDEYTAQIFLFALDSESGDTVGLQIGAAYGVAVGFKTTAVPTPFRGHSGVIAELITVSRSSLVQAYVIVIVITVWLITLMFMFATVSLVCGYPLDVGVLVVPVATLFAITQLRASMPGAPEGFGAIVDYVGLLPCLALMSFSASLTIGAVIFTHPDQDRVAIWHLIPRPVSKWDRKPGKEDVNASDQAFLSV